MIYACYTLPQILTGHPRPLKSKRLGNCVFFKRDKCRIRTAVSKNQGHVVNLVIAHLPPIAQKSIVSK